MTIGKEIKEQAAKLFDVAGATLSPEGDNLLILGLESTPERNLDEFVHEGGNFILYGFRKYASPRLESLIEFIRNQGFSAETVKRYGYPLKGEINLKAEAIRAGLGLRGKNTVVLHPAYGPRLRFMAVRTNAPVDSVVSSALFEKENPICRDCSICIDACPATVLEPYRMTEPRRCLSNVTPRTEDGRSILCDKCLILCPAGSVKH